MNRRYLAATLSCAILFSASFGAIAALAPHPRFLWNASASAPIGLYRIVGAPRPRVGDLVAIRPPTAVERFLARRHYLPAGVPLIKRVAAVAGTTICRSGALVMIDGRAVATALARDRARRPLPQWSGCRTLRGGELFLLNAAPDSLDSRYFGPFPASGLIGTAHPLLTRGAPGAPLRWHRAGDPMPSLLQPKGSTR